MRAEHRHELKTNELALWLANLPQWAAKNVRIITYVTVAVVLALGALFYHHYQKKVVAVRVQANMTALLAQLPQAESQIAQAASQGMDSSYTLLQPVGELQNIAQNSGQNVVAAIALIKAAQILRTELLFRQGAVSRQDLETQTARAKENYTKALDILKKTPNAAMEALANFGVGLCEEDLGNFEQAKTIYKEVAANPAFEGTTASAAAKLRLETMDSYINTKIALRPAPAPPPAPAAEMPYGPRRTPQAEPTTIAPQTPAAPAPISSGNPPTAK
jgi:tetratricopeptide (TPR) repeat protein